MHILTDEEKLYVFRNKSQYAFNSDAGQIEIFDLAAEAVIKRLAAGVSVEPVACVARSNDMEGLVQWALKRVHVGVDLFTLDQLNTERAAARVQMNEVCAKVCARYRDLPAGYSETKIRALLGKEQS